MRLVYKGIYKDADQLPEGILPSHAVKFVEADTPAVASLYALLSGVLALVFVFPFVVVFYFGHGEVYFEFTSGLWIAFVLFFLSLIPHEFFHSLCFGKDAEVGLYALPLLLMMFVVSTQPITKRRFIILMILPNLVLGWIPLALWAVLPYNVAYSNILLVFSALSITAGGGDYCNIFNAVRQMPKGSMQQMSGFNSYWFLP